MAGTETTPRHTKRESFHRRRGFEISHASNFEEIEEGTSPGQNSQVATKQEPDGTEFDCRTMDLQVGQIVRIRDIPGLCVIYWVDGDMIGVELEGPYGSGDGMYQNKRHFLCPFNCALFVAKEQVDRVYNNIVPPRMRSVSSINVGDVVMISKQIGVGVVKFSRTDLIGCQLNGPVGDSDGSYEGRPYFSTKPQHATFVHPRTVKKIEAEALLRKLNDAVTQLQKLQAQLQVVEQK